VSPTGDAVSWPSPRRTRRSRSSPSRSCAWRRPHQPGDRLPAAHVRFTGLQSSPWRWPRLRVALPEGARVGMPAFSNDGGASPSPATSRTGRAVDGRDGDGPRPRRPRRPAQRRPRPAIGWTGDGRLLVRAVPAGRGRAPQAPSVPVGPIVEETAGKASQMETFQTCSARRTTRPSSSTTRGRSSRSSIPSPHGDAGRRAGLLTDAEPSPDGRFLLVHQAKRPSRPRPYFYFARTVEVWTRRGSRWPPSPTCRSRTRSRGRGADRPREVAWQPLQPATLGWVEASTAATRCARCRTASA